MVALGAARAIVASIVVALVAFAPAHAERRTPGAAARGVGRVTVGGGTLHVRGTLMHQTSRWGGAYIREPPPVIAVGNVLRVRRGETNEPSPPVAEVVTDEQGFDVALPPGVWCLVAAYNDDWFKGWAHAGRDFDRACLKARAARCDLVARLEKSDLDGVRITTTQWHPPSAPCRVRPYVGPSPP